MSIICPNWLIGYAQVPAMDYHIMPKKFNSLFCCGCEITHVKKAGKESRQCRISESALSK
jgi:hypothetical protein